MENVKIFSLGGLDENGKWMYIVEINDDIFVLDAGSKKPEQSMPGIEYILPDFSYLIENKNKVKAIFITQPIDEALCAVPRLLEAVHAPIYTSRIGRYYITKNAKLFNVDLVNTVWNIVEINAYIQIAGHKIAIFGTTTSLPYSFGVAVHTNQGYITYASSFFFDFSAEPGFKTDLPFLADIAREKVLLSFIDSKNCHTVGFTSPNHKITSLIRDEFETDNRLIFGLFSKDIFRFNEIVKLAVDFKKKILLYSRSQRNEINDFIKQNIIYYPEDLFVDFDYTVKHQDYIIILAGEYRHLYRELFRLQQGNAEKNLFLSENDTIIVINTDNLGYEKNISDALDELYKSPAKIKAFGKKEIIKLEASQEDIKLMLKLLNPKYIVPINAEYKNLYENCQLIFEQLMISPTQIILMVDPSNPEEIIQEHFRDGERVFVQEKPLKVTDNFVDGYGFGEAGNTVLFERKKLYNSGVVILGVGIDKKNKTINTSIDIQMRGFIFVKMGADLNRDLEAIVNQAVVEVNTSGWNLEYLKEIIISRFKHRIYKFNKKEPVIIPCIVEN
ncbi:MAG: ribonuclease J [Bacillales bacterium]|nr:ribonuclease J [Bacillales bacterium]